MRLATYVFTMIECLLQQIKQRRLFLNVKQSDMLLRVGVSRQQYQRLETKGNPRLETLELIAQGLNSELMLIPKEKLNAVLAVLKGDDTALSEQSVDKEINSKTLSDDPWQDFLGIDP